MSKPKEYWIEKKHTYTEKQTGKIGDFYVERSVADKLAEAIEKVAQSKSTMIRHCIGNDFKVLRSALKEYRGDNE